MRTSSESLEEVMTDEFRTLKDHGSSAVRDDQQIWEWNRPPPEAVSTCAHYLIEARTLEQPNSSAICSWDGDLTYGELEDLSSRLAGFLTGHGVGPEVLVPLCFEKSRWTIVAMLAVLKAGGAFVPLDSTQPISRLESAIRQTNSGLALSSRECARICKNVVDFVFIVDAESVAELGKGPAGPGPLSPTTAAYVIFTSGSTGKPKGVVIEHEQLSTSSTKGGKAMGFESKPRVLQFASYAFDACILEIITTLIFGGCVCVPSDWERMNNLVDAMNRMQVTSAFFTPSLLSNLRFETLKTLNTVILGGESLPAALVQTWAAKLRLILAYGPTECCVICFTLDTTLCTPGPGDIGRAISGRAWIVDPNDLNLLAPLGTVGELLIEGPILARGYLNDTAKTEAGFIHAPSWMPKQKGQLRCRMYRTGDLVKYNNDGSIRFVGRIDNQVKLRGQRLELGEVEHHLRNCLLALTGVAEVVVELVVSAGERSSPFLAAVFRIDEGMDSLGYLEWREDEMSTPVISETEQQRLKLLISEIQAKMLLVLPAYAIPMIYIPVRRVPISASGKADRRRLRSIAAELPLSQLARFSVEADGSSNSAHISPSSPIERQLQDLWSEVLKISYTDISLDDNFFWLGGDSVAAIGLVAAARTAGLYLTVETIFTRPTLSDMALLTTQLAKHGDWEIAPFALIDRLDGTNCFRDEASIQCEINKDLIEDIYPCSPTQQGLMALSLKEAGTYVMQLVYPLPLSLDLVKFQAAWQAVATCNPILRTRFFETASAGLLQVVVREPLHWQTYEEQSLKSYLAEDKRVPMQMGHPMSWYALIRNPEASEYQFVWTVHHSLLDGWSLSRVISCVQQTYAGRPVAPAPGFNTFIKYLSSRDIEASKTFWCSHLTDALSPTFPRLPSPTYRPLGNTSFTHEALLSRKARSIITTATIIKAAWSLLIGIYSNTTDVITGITLNGRTAKLPGIEDIVGPTIVTVPFRTQFRAHQPITEFLNRIQQLYIDMIPFEQLGLQDIKLLSAGAEAACDFRSLLVIQSTRQPDLNGVPPGLLSTKQDITLSLDYGLTMECELYDNRVMMRATVDDNLLSRVQIQRLFRQFEQLLHQLCSEDPTMKVSDVQTICEADIEEVLEWNTIVPKGSLTCVHDLIQQRTRSQPDRLSICSWDGELSYVVLEELSSRLASHLANHRNVGPGTMVPVCFEKSKWAIVAMLAVLKAGGACVPFDPKHPVSRLKMMVGDLGQKGASMILTSASSASLCSSIKFTLVVGPSLFEELPTDPCTTPEKASPSDPAFVIFTSGSTGKPKGVVLEHMAVCTSAREHGRVIQLNDQSRVLQFAAYTFDISISDIFVTLIYGGCVCIPSEHDKMNNLPGAIQSLNANQACLTSTVASYLHPEDVKGLRVLVVAGEPLTREVVERWADNVALINMYGPAECTIYCIGKPNIQRNDHPSIIGRGVGALVWITNPDDSNSLTPIGGTGELLIEGPTLARGYLSNEAQTKVSFIEDPAWIPRNACSHGPRRMYKTGDLAHYNTDGSISFVGRKDDGQVKLRGQRMELGEVEYQLRQCLSSPVEATALVITPTHGRPTLAAFIPTGDGTSVPSTQESIAQSPAQLELFQSLTAGLEPRLASVLPAYMVPSVFVPVSRIPLTTSGKTDRKKLQQMAAKLSVDQLAAFRELRTEHVPPSTRMEQRLHDLWKRLLHIKDMGIGDNFFQLGGDSITAMRLVAAARKNGLSLSVDKIFKNPLLSEMALITHENASELSTDVPPFSLLENGRTAHFLNEAALQCNVGKDRIEDIYPCTPQQEYWIRGGIETHEHQAQTVYSLPPSLDLNKFCTAWDAVASCHAILRTRIIRTSSAYLQVVVKGGLEWQRETSLEQYLSRDRASLIGLGDRLQRFCIIEDDGLGGRFFVFTAQHSSYDGWSLHLLFEDLGYAYKHGFSSASGAKFNRFIKVLIDTDAHAASMFWQSQLAGVHSRPLFVIPEGHRIFPDTQWKRKIRLSAAQGSGITVSTMIEVAWSIVFARTLGCNDVVLDILRAGRTTPVPGIEDLVAPTCTALPLRVHVDPQQRTHGLLLSVQQQLSDMTEFEHRGFDNIASLNEEVASACKHSIRINIAPPLGDTPPRDSIDLPLIWAELALILPFRIDCAITKNGVDVEAVFDKDVISIDRVDQLLRQFEEALQQVSLPDGKQKIEDIDLTGTSEVDSYLLESISAESGRVRQLMLASSPYR